MNLSGIELYYAEPGNISGNLVSLSGDDFRHVKKVMRHSVGDTIYITNGTGKIFSADIISIGNDELQLNIKETYSYENRFKNIYFCIPKIKSPDRFEFALEKCVEIGITNFIVFESQRSYKKGEKPERWNKILISAMKQSLRSYLPKLEVAGKLNEIKNNPAEKIILDQNAEKLLTELSPQEDKKYYFIFGPEGGLADEESEVFSGSTSYKLTENRLRTETAVIVCASLICTG